MTFGLSFLPTKYLLKLYSIESNIPIKYLKIINNTAMNNLNNIVQIYFCIFGGVFSGQIPRNGIVSQNVSAYVV